MNRRDFAQKISSLILDMISAGRHPIFDRVLAFAEDQRRLYNKGRELIDGNWVVVDPSAVVTNCDGYKKISEHQFGTAADIYLVSESVDGLVRIEYDWDEAEAEYWHDIWVNKYGGKPMISIEGSKKDKPHFAG